MRKLATASLLAAALLLLASPVSAGTPIETLQDDFNPDTGQGIALVYHGGNVYEYIWYVDGDGNGMYSEGDKILRSQLVRVMPL